MDVTQEFLVLPSNGAVLIYGVRDFPSGTPVGRDAQRIRIVGPVWVRPPRPELTQASGKTGRPSSDRPGSRSRSDRSGRRRPAALPAAGGRAR